MKRSLTLLFAFLSVQALAGTDNPYPGSRSAALGSASVTLSDVWSTTHNQAGLGFVKHTSAGMYYEQRFLLSALGLKIAAVAVPVKGGCFGLSFSSFGYSLYSESKIGLAYGKAFGEKIAAGVQLSHISARLGDNYGSKSALVGEIGLQFRMIKQLTIGTHIYNITRTRFADHASERIPTIMRLGMNYEFSRKVFIAVEVEKDMEQKAAFKAGCEYQVVEALYLRAGISTNPSLSCFGLGLALKNFRLDLSSSYHAVLGLSPQVGMSYDFN